MKRWISIAAACFALVLLFAVSCFASTTDPELPEPANPVVTEPTEPETPEEPEEPIEPENPEIVDAQTEVD